MDNRTFEKLEKIVFNDWVNRGVRHFGVADLVFRVREAGGEMNPYGVNESPEYIKRLVARHPFLNGAFEERPGVRKPRTYPRLENIEKRKAKFADIAYSVVLIFVDALRDDPKPIGMMKLGRKLVRQDKLTGFDSNMAPLMADYIIENFPDVADRVLRSARRAEVMA